MADSGVAAIGWVDEAPVTPAELDAYLAGLAGGLLGARLGIVAEPTTDQDKAKALEIWGTKSLLVDRLIEQEARRLALPFDAAPDDWLAALEANGELEATTVSEAEAQAYYAANSYRFALHDARRVRHVLVADEATARRLLAEAAAGADLGELASAYSIDAGTRAGLGDLGWVGRGLLAGALEEVIFAARPGALTGPVRSAFGWHVLRVEEVRAESLRPFAQFRSEIIAELGGIRRREALRSWLDRRIAEAIRVPPGVEHPLSPGLPGGHHRH